MVGWFESRCLDGSLDLFVFVFVSSNGAIRCLPLPSYLRSRLRVPCVFVRPVIFERTPKARTGTCLYYLRLCFFYIEIGNVMVT